MAPKAGRVPPHDLQAEESLLGAMLLSKEAIAVAGERLRPDDFYKPAHGHIYEAITSLSAAGEPADPVTVSDELRRAGLLEACGGPSVLVHLQNDTPATSNAGRYAKIIEDHALLRRMIGVAGEIAELSYDLPDDVAKAVDHAESMVFDVAQRRVTDSMAPIHDLLDKNLDHLEQLYERGQSITGVPTGFPDLDELTSGLQPNALYVIGARPAMGKTAFALNMASHAALEIQRPVLLFSLEMGQIELTQRILCSEARVDSKRVRNGNLTEADWGKIAHATGRLAEAPIWIDDNPNLTIMEIRSKARRLRSRVGDLGLIVVDYLQLMTGRSNAESRQVEISEISRGLKILARELECPVIALSQLSRQLEQRADKRPMLSDLRESGCLTADTVITRSDTGGHVTMGELYESGARDIPVWAMDEHHRMVPATMTHVFATGTRPVFRMTMASGRRIDATANHKFVTVDGWKPLGDLQPGEHKLATMFDAESELDLDQSDVEWDAIAAIEPIGEQPVFDGTVPGPHNFLANGIVAHNSIEQDADVVAFIYRDEVYNPDSPDQGQAEIIVAKHRNGPTGSVRLAFLGQYTKFASMAKVP